MITKQMNELTMPAMENCELDVDNIHILVKYLEETLSFT